MQLNFELQVTSDPMSREQFATVTKAFFLLSISCASWYYAPVDVNYVSTGFAIFLAFMCLNVSLKGNLESMPPWSRIGLATIPFLLMPSLLLLELVSRHFSAPSLFLMGKAIVAVFWFSLTLHLWHLSWRGAPNKPANQIKTNR